MATTVTVYDLENYPNNSKTVIVDHKQVVPAGAGGDEKWVISATTTATASGSVSILPVFIRTFTLGWCKSTGFNQGPYTINSTQNTFKISINGSTYRTVTLSNQVTAVSGDAVALDMETKINELAVVGGAEAGNLAFKNAWVEFENGKFTIQSGSPASSYTGSNRTSVDVIAGDSNDVSVHLGFYAPVTSEDIASTGISETYVSFPYTASSGLTYIDVNNYAVASTGDCIGITDGTNTEYRYVSSAGSGVININAALSNNYANNSRIQVLRLQDPVGQPLPSFSDIDDATRYAISSLVNQIDFS